MDLAYLRLTTLVLAVFFGVLCFVVARYLRVPAIVPLLIAGFVLGPEVLGVIDTDALGDGMRLIISLSVAVILFEGGLTLDPEGFKKAPRVIRRLLTVGVLVTWFGTAALVYLLFGLSPAMSLLAGSLIIVTGPTVIAPLLQRVRVKEKLHHILHWEGVVIDPIGVFIAILCFEWLSAESAIISHFGHLSLRLVIGIVVGFAGGKMIYWLLNKNWVSEHDANIFVFAAALFLFGISDLMAHEAGILTVVVAGLVLGWHKPPSLKYIRKFKTDLTELAIGLLFILLAAHLEVEDFIAFGWKGVILILAVLLLIRPLGIALCTFRTALTIRERLFLSWIAPRGVVAGSMASLFALELSAADLPGASFLEAFTFAVIGSTILIQGLTARTVAGVLKVREAEKKGWLIVGAHYFSRKIAEFIARITGGPCVLVDTNADAIQRARMEGLTAIEGNALSPETVPADLLPAIGNVLALTDNRDLNELICVNWAEYVPKHRLYRWSYGESESAAAPGGVGIPVWLDLAKPSSIAYDLRHKEAQIRIRRFTAPLKNRKGTVSLVAGIQGKIRFPELTATGASEGEMLQLQQLTQHLPLVTRPEFVIRETEAELLPVLKQLFELAQQAYPELAEIDILTPLLEREKNFPTVLSYGVVAPHARCAALKESICLIARVPGGIDYPVPGGERARLVFLLISSEADPEMHLILLAEIAKIASDPVMVERILEAPGGIEVIQALLEMEQ